MSPIVAILALLAAVWLWMNSLRAREHALFVCRKSCREMELQLLDQTVQLASMGLGRNERGRLSIRRFYGFEFSADGVARNKGGAAMLGLDVEYVELDHPDGLTIIEPRGRTNVRVF
ncbi:MAG: DUF3301 domain-containing protein [Gammaproteobacteria bacterium]